MKAFLLVFIFSIPSIACMNKISLSEARKAIALEPNAGINPCDGSEPCLCFDDIEWKAARLARKNGKDVLENDPIKLAPILAAKQADDEARELKSIEIENVKTELRLLPESPERRALLFLLKGEK